MAPYRFNAKKGQFHVLADTNQEQALVDRIQVGASAHLFSAILVAPVLTSGGARLQHHNLSTVHFHRDWVWREPWQDDAGADPDVCDELLDDVLLPPPLVVYEYKVCLQFKDAFQLRPRDWPLRLLNGNDNHSVAPLTSHLLKPTVACTPLTASTMEQAVEVMQCQHYRSWGHFTLDDATLTMLLQHRYHSLTDEPKVLDTICKHVPLKRVADVDYQQRILCMWKKNFPDEANRLQLRRCDRALPLLGRYTRAPYMKGWQQWMTANINPNKSPQSDLSSSVRVRPLLLIGPPKLEASEWARSHGPHIYMHGRLDLALLHDCLADGHAQYIVLDKIDWELLLRESGHGHSILTNATFNWYRGSRVHTTSQHLPVIVLNSHLPKPNDACWAPRGWEHWKAIFQFVKLLPQVPLFESCTAHTGGGNSKAVTHNEDTAVEQAAGDQQHLLSLPPTTPSPPSVDLLELASELNLSATKQERTEGPPPLTLDMRERIQFGPDSFLYPHAIPTQHRQRLLQVVEEMDYVQMKYRGRDLARQKAFQSDNIAGSYAFYEYTGSVPDVWHMGDWSPECLEMRDALRSATKEPVNSLVGNQYLDGDACIDHHSDKTPDIQRGTSIWTISLGDTRAFELRKLDQSQTLTVELTHGSVFQIGPLTNAAYTHSIPQMPHGVGPRYGLTFRTLASRWLHDEQIALRQPAKDGEPWLVQKKATRLDENGQMVVRQQDGYPSRRVVHLQPFALKDAQRVQEEDVVRLRQLLSTLKRSSLQHTDESAPSSPDSRVATRKKRRVQ